MQKDNNNIAQIYFDNANVIVLALDAEAKVLLINEKGCEVLGCKQKEVIGKHWFSNFLPSDYCLQYQRCFEKIMSGELDTFRDEENPILTKQGEERIISWHNSYFKDERGNIIGTLSCGQDVTGYRQAEKKLRKSEILIQTLINSLPFDVFAIDLDGCYLMQNTACKKNWGDIIDKRPNEVAPNKRILKIWEDNNIKAFGGEVVEGEECFECNGRKKYIYNIVSPLYDKGSVIGIIGVNIDITDLKNAEVMLKGQKIDLEKKNIALQEIIAQIEIEKSKIKENIAINVSEFLMPTLKRMKIKGVSKKHVEFFESQLKSMTSAFGRNITKKELKLTPREIEVCDMIKNGLASKEIANLLHISLQTVEKHRGTIRKKLGISGKGINLTTYLQKN